MSEDILKPMKIEDSVPVKRNTSDCYLSLLKEEIKEIKSKFEANNRQYDVQDLVRLTENSMNILRREEMSRRQAGYENCMKNESDSVYFDLELERMKLEKTIGLNTFLMAYRKMIDILNGNTQMDSEKEMITSGSATYVLPKEEYSGDYRKEMERMWTTIIEAFGAKQQYIPDTWECAVRESVYY
ncbi:UNVERIFIED_CONTAM: hypothetical protein PYX00_004442 [Menopon gallinae]|uniref:Uncharacterized protein n=1 Tax=Menopon gallinae TaxID=328185 RepID=A0AAW2I5P4_9NEOP